MAPLIDFLNRLLALIVVAHPGSAGQGQQGILLVDWYLEQLYRLGTKEARACVSQVASDAVYHRLKQHPVVQAHVQEYLPYEEMSEIWGYQWNMRISVKYEDISEIWGYQWNMRISVKYEDISDIWGYQWYMSEIYQKYEILYILSIIFQLYPSQLYPSQLYASQLYPSQLITCSSSSTVISIRQTDSGIEGRA